MSRELLLAGIGGKEKSFHLVLQNNGGWEDSLKVGAAVQMHAILCQWVHWVDTKYLENRFCGICLLTGFKWSSYFTVEEKYIQCS